MKTKVNHLFIGKPKQFKKPGLKSSINREQVSSIIVKENSIIGDEVSNKKYHGGKNRVLHFYPQEHYEHFKNKYDSDSFQPGTIGENLTTQNLTEENVNIGDIFKVGSVVCQITEPRFPCGIIDLQYGIRGMNKECLFDRKLGWFAKVIQEGQIKKDDEVELIDRVYENLSLDKCIEALNEEGFEKVLEEMINNPVLSESWKNKASKRLALKL
jgi:MOSC domain-containing protein YiiM